MTFSQIQIGDVFTLTGNPYKYRKTREVKCGLNLQYRVNAFCLEGGVWVFVEDSEEIMKQLHPSFMICGADPQHEGGKNVEACRTPLSSAEDEDEGKKSVLLQQRRRSN